MQRKRQLSVLFVGDRVYTLYTPAKCKPIRLLTRQTHTSARDRNDEKNQWWCGDSARIKQAPEFELMVRVVHIICDTKQLFFFEKISGLNPGMQTNSVGNNVCVGCHRDVVDVRLVSFTLSLGDRIANSCCSCCCCCAAATVSMRNSTQLLVSLVMLLLCGFSGLSCSVVAAVRYWVRRAYTVLSSQLKPTVVQQYIPLIFLRRPLVTYIEHVVI